MEAVESGAINQSNTYLMVISYWSRLVSWEIRVRTLPRLRPFFGQAKGLFLSVYSCGYESGGGDAGKYRVIVA